MSNYITIEQYKAFLLKENQAPTADNNIPTSSSSNVNTGLPAEAQTIYDRYIELCANKISKPMVINILANEFKKSIFDICGTINTFPSFTESKTNEGYLDPVSPKRMQNKVDEVNALIEQAKDRDGDPLGVIDSSSTWQSAMKFKPFKYVNGFLYSEYEEYDNGMKFKKERFKPSNSFDAFQWLSQVATWYRRAIKKEQKLNSNPPTNIQENYTPKESFTRDEVINMLEDVYAQTAASFNDYGKDESAYRNSAKAFVDTYMKDK